MVYNIFMANGEPHCYRCGDRNPENFYKDKTRGCGYSSRCKKCNGEVTEPLRKQKPKTMDILPDGSFKYCPQCDSEKEVNEFYESQWRRDGRSSICKKCRADTYDNNKEGIKFKRILSTFGLTKEEYMKMLDEQDGVCGICHQRERSIRFKYLAVDHCHITGKIRGLLCHRCNKGLGHFADSIELFQNAISYLS